MEHHVSLPEVGVRESKRQDIPYLNGWGNVSNWVMHLETTILKRGFGNSGGTTKDVVSNHKVYNLGTWRILGTEARGTAEVICSG